MNLKEGDVDITKVIIVALVWVADEQFTLRIVVLQPILQGSTYEATSDNSNVDYVDVEYEMYIWLLIIFSYCRSTRIRTLSTCVDLPEKSEKA